MASMFGWVKARNSMSSYGSNFKPKAMVRKVGPQQYFANKYGPLTRSKRGYYGRGRKPLSYGNKFAVSNAIETRSLDYNFFSAYPTAGVYVPDLLNETIIPINQTGAIQSLNNIQQGTGLSQRLGNRVTLKSLRCRFNIQAVPRNYGSVNNLRFMIIYDRAPNGAYNTVGQILKNLLQDNTTNVGDYTDNLNPSYFDRIKVLKDIKMVLPPYSSSQTFNSNGPYDESNYLIDFYLDLKGLECVYSLTSNPAVISNSSVGSLQIVVLGDQAANTEPWSLYGTTRIRFNGN